MDSRSLIGLFQRRHRLNQLVEEAFSWLRLCRHVDGELASDGGTDQP